MKSLQERDRDSLEAFLRGSFASGWKARHGSSVAAVQAFTDDLSLRRLREMQGALVRYQQSQSIDPQVVLLLRDVAVSLDRPSRDRKTVGHLLVFLGGLLARAVEGREAATPEVVGLDDPEVIALAQDLLDAYEHRRVILRGSKRGDLGVPLGDAPRHTTDALVESLGYAGLGAMWTPISVDQAYAIVLHVLRYDLAYRDEVLPAAEADSLAQRFMALVGGSAQFLTNGNLIIHAAPDGMKGSWMPLTGATFDSGVVALDDERVLMVWGEDED